MQYFLLIKKSHLSVLATISNEPQIFTPLSFSSYNSMIKLRMADSRMLQSFELSPSGLEGQMKQSMVVFLTVKIISYHSFFSLLPTKILLTNPSFSKALPTLLRSPNKEILTELSILLSHQKVNKMLRITLLLPKEMRMMMKRKQGLKFV